MNRIIAALGRLLVIGTTAFGIAAIASVGSHKSYWQGTIRNVQTVDFNILSNTLPTKLSYALLKHNSEELQRTVNSNYGLFGIVVTDCNRIIWECPNQKILYMTESRRSWKDLAQVDRLRYHPFDLLRDPPPLIAERGYDNAHDTSWATIGTKNKGKVIGRVYYIRGIPPSFQQDYLRWLSNPTSTSSAHKYYMLTAALFITGGIAAWIFIEWLYARKKQKELQAEEEIRQLQRASDALQEQLQEQLDHASELIAERVQHVTQLENYGREQEERVKTLNQTIKQMEQQSFTVQVNDDVQATLQADIQRREEAIAALQSQIADYEQASDQSTQSTGILNQNLSEAVQDLQRAKQQIELEERERQQTSALIEQLHQQVEEAKQREAQAHKEREEMEESLGGLKQQKEILEAQFKDATGAGSNDFEEKIVECLTSNAKSKSDQWITIPQMDVGHKMGNRQFVDCLLIGKSYVVVIEAKNYGGQIKSAGNPRATEWFSYKVDGGSSKIKCSKTNPYEQVNTYADSVMGRISQEVSQRRVRVFSVVVFPDNADVSALVAEIGGFCRVILLKDLVMTMEEFEQTAAEQSKDSRPLRSPQQIKNMLYGIKELSQDRREIAPPILVSQSHKDVPVSL